MVAGIIFAGIVVFVIILSITSVVFMDKKTPEEKEVKVKEQSPTPKEIIYEWLRNLKDDDEITVELLEEFEMQTEMPNISRVLMRLFEYKKPIIWGHVKEMSKRYWQSELNECIALIELEQKDKEN